MSTSTTSHDRAWYAVAIGDAATLLQSDPANGLSSADAARRAKEDGPNSIPKEPPPSRLSIAAAQLADPMNIMLVAVAVIRLTPDNHGVDQPL